MHLIEGNLDSTTTLLTSATAVISLGAACFGVRKELSAKHVPSLLAMAGMIYLAQMLNCSSGLGFSCHLIGASLLALMFGPYAAMLSMGGILTLQVGLLGDGSLSTLGANFLNMGLVAPWAAYGILRWMRAHHSSTLYIGHVAALALASFGSIVAASSSLYLMIGGSLWNMFLMASVWGLLESGIAVAVFFLCARKQTHPYKSFKSVATLWRVALRPLAFVACLALCLIPFSSQEVDGLEYHLHAVESGSK